MTILFIIIAVLAIFAAWFIFSSIRLRLVFDEPIRLVEVSYTFARLSADFKEYRARIRLFGIKIFEKDMAELLKSDKKKDRPEKRTKDTTGKTTEELLKGKLKEDIKAEKPDEEKREKQEKKAKPKKPRSGFDLSLINLKNLKRLKNFIGKINIEHLDLNIEGGFSDPYRTGQLTASYWVVRGMFPALMAHVQYHPDFKIEKFIIRGKGVVSLRGVHILVLVIQLLSAYLISKVRHRFKYQEKGMAYVG